MAVIAYFLKQLFKTKESDPHIEKLFYNLTQYELGGINIHGK